MHRPHARLAIAGGWDAREEARLSELAARHGVAERVRFLGQLARDQVRAAYDQASAVVFPVIWEEPWGPVPLEAMARGRPVVATGRGGSGEYLVDGVNAVLFKEGDEVALARAISRLAGDGALRRRIREGGFRTASRYPSSAFNDAVLREVVGAPRQASGSALSGQA